MPPDSGAEGDGHRPGHRSGEEAAGTWELGRVALVLGGWCVGGLLLCLTTFRWTTKRDG